MKSYRMFIDGDWTDSSDKKLLSVLNPATGQTIARVPEGSVQDARAAIDSAHDAFHKGKWPLMTPSERSKIILRLAELTERSISRLARIESMNQGRPFKECRDSDFPFGVDNIRFFAGASRALEGISSNEFLGSGTSIIRREPIGVVSCIIPWNYPWMIAVWKMIPAIATGNAVVAKPASLTPLSLLEFGRIIQKAGVPRGVVNIVTGLGSTVGDEIVKNPKINMVSMTGSTETGKSVMQQAAGTLKRVSLELGGKAPFIVFEDADVNAAATGAANGAFVNSGQDCTAATRFYVHKRIYEKFIRAFVSKTEKIRIGNPLDRTTDMGPLISESHRRKVEKYADIGRKEGAKLVVGGRRPRGKQYENGFYFEPTVFIDAEQDMAIVQEEIFGPVVAVLPFESTDDVIRKANDIAYGLAGSVWTKDIYKATRVANEIRCGEVWINDHLPLASELPHGGFKQSGFGKDLSVYALHEYTEMRHVYIDTSGHPV
ncbi:MAG TPA: aminobutyraldehyde dehydrogenase [Nitrososphaera sp.]